MQEEMWMSQYPTHCHNYVYISCSSGVMVSAVHLQLQFGTKEIKVILGLGCCYIK